MTETVRHELWRKAIHAGTLVLPVWIAVAPDPLRLRGLLLAFLFFLAVDLARLCVPPLARWSERRIGPYLRPRELQRPTSAHYLTFAAVVLAWMAPRGIAAAALAFPALGDAAAAIVGRRWGRRRWGEKSLEGSAAFFVGCVAGGLVFLPDQATAVLAAGVVTTLVEALPLPVDDNLSVPVVAALALALLV